MTIGAPELRSFIAASIPALDAGTEAVPAKRLFTPPGHRDALRPDTTLVVGGRGVGKTVWSRALEDSESRRLAAVTYDLPALDELRVLRGHGELAERRRYPGPAAIARLLATGSAPRDIWRAVVLRSLSGEVAEEINWSDAVLAVAQNEVGYEEQVEDLAAETTSTLIVFDALDRCSTSRAVAQALVDALLDVAFDLRTRTSSIRLKVFLRPDLVGQLGFVDSSKVKANRSDLTWVTTALYGALFTHLANSDDQAGAEAFRAMSNHDWTLVAKAGWRSVALSGDTDAQRSLLASIASPYMGSNHRRGHTYPWIPSHLADGTGVASPRSFLKAVQQAADVTARDQAQAGVALHWQGIRAGVQGASQVRRDEVVEDMPWVAGVMGVLGGLTVPVAEADVVGRWSLDLLASLVGSEEPPSADSDEVFMQPLRSASADGLIRELIRLGLMTRRKDERLDVPDVYRIAFGIGRKGGVQAVG